MTDKRFFIDTNIFVYSFDNKNSTKRDQSRTLINSALKSKNGYISYQVMQEFLNVATRKFDKPLNIADAKLYLENVLEPMCQVYASINLLEQALDISHRWQYSFYDSLIIAAAQSSQCKVLYSEDMQHEQKIGNLQILNPFLVNPKELL